MRYSRFTQVTGALLMLVVAGLNPAHAQSAAPEEALRLIASRSVGMPEATFEVSSKGAVLTVTRVNSTLNASSHQGRNNESAAIAKAITAEFARKGPQYSGIQSISVDYVDRTGTPTHDSLIDRIDFRKNAAGKFELHIT
jgi:hypothetical protein